ncbi:hypothetical protein JD844_027518 [Phrynosoma platyrhinos]|uniref:Coiled-coil domain-containing protein 3 n=1 Tax=Phrynosoma platyrhinos TaxID=52577 RepID=A0ABQ7SGK0_PHRPL|nr:hypothetical protein JD844_027518 [Phrynosoma platyrhinos]
MGCQLPSDWRPLSESCRAELAEIIVYAKVLALHQDMYSMYNYLPWQYEATDGGLFYSAEIEMLCDQAWGSMLEVPAGSRMNLTGLGMDENYNLLPHGVNFQDAIFPDTQENRRMFSSLFQFSNCTQGQHAISFSSDWEIQEDNRVAPSAAALRTTDVSHIFNQLVFQIEISVVGMFTPSDFGTLFFLDG